MRLGVLGCADIAARRILPAVAAEPSLRTVAVGSRSVARAREFARRFDCDAVHGYQAVLDRDDVDAVYVPLPAALHAEWIERALLAGKHVLAEKPFTTDAATTEKLVALARSSGLVVAENFMFLRHSAHAAVAAALAAGEIGALRSMTATFTIPRREPGDIRLNRELGGGALLDVGSYPLRVAHLLLGPDLVVAGAVLRHDPAHGVDVGGSALLYRRDGVTALLSFGLDDVYTCEYELCGATGRMLLRRAFTPPADHRPVLRIVRADGVEERLLPADDQVANTLRAFVAAVRDGTTDDTIVRQAALLDSVRTDARRTS
ncbi:Gfo/Idh/MocA family protein [Catenuloplanes japonicus]|uniref:Gfo/Idh/MocA family protein n=1 Tax=Catenuloplanes japonicus TaxID=33876 RepID=UPI000527EE3D|nr:Gfo/Idh/MocA family oxidoreductase [Catenuloplanes japonicus]